MAKSASKHGVLPKNQNSPDMLTSLLGDIIMSCLGHILAWISFSSQLDGIGGTKKSGSLMPPPEDWRI